MSCLLYHARHSETLAGMLVYLAEDVAVRVCVVNEPPADLNGEPLTAIAAPTHRHYKGGLYAMLHSNAIGPADEALVVYQHDDGEVWVRPAEMWSERLPDGRERFAPLA